MKTFKDLKVGDTIFCIDCFYPNCLYKYKILEIEDNQSSIIRIRLQGHSEFCIYVEAYKSIGPDMFGTYYADAESVLQGLYKGL